MSFGGDTLFTIFGLPFTNTMLSVFLVDLIIIFLAIAIRKRNSLIPSNLQSAVESVFDFISGLMDGLIPKKYTKKIFPWLMTFFVFIILNNWIGLLPGMETIYIKEDYSHENVVVENLKEDKQSEEEGYSDKLSTKTSDQSSGNKDNSEENTHELALFKGANADPNVTIALAVVSFLFIHFSVFILRGGKNWLYHFFHVKGQKIGLVAVFAIIGLLEIVLEPLKYISLGLRLFGNILAGEILVTYMNGLAPFVALPFMLLEILVGFLQALIFVGLTVAFLGSMLKEDY